MNKPTNHAEQAEYWLASADKAYWANRYNAGQTAAQIALVHAELANIQIGLALSVPSGDTVDSGSSEVDAS